MRYPARRNLVSNIATDYYKPKKELAYSQLGKLGKNVAGTSAAFVAFLQELTGIIL